jgi:hypothetical protein
MVSAIPLYRPFVSARQSRVPIVSTNAFSQPRLIDRYVGPIDSSPLFWLNKIAADWCTLEDL